MNTARNRKQHLSLIGDLQARCSQTRGDLAAAAREFVAVCDQSPIKTEYRNWLGAGAAMAWHLMRRGTSQQPPRSSVFPFVLVDAAIALLQGSWHLRGVWRAIRAWRRAWTTER